MESPCSDGPVLHIAVVGFHHKKGCQLEFSYPPLVPGAAHDSSDLPDEWKYLPFLALPDGAHNHQEDTVYFNLPPLSGHQRCVHCVSCYRQMEAKALKVREADVTRETVQKSVCVLSRAPLYGLIQAKLQLITHAYFEEKDFSQISILKELYEHMNRSLSCTTLDGSQLYLGLSARDLILHFKHKVLVLFKLILLEKRILFHVTPVKRLVETLMSVLSLFPGMIQHGLSESATYQPRRSVSEEAGSSGPPRSREEEEPGQADAFGPVTVQPQSSCAQEDRFGLPLAIFTKGYLCLPYMALQQHHLLSDLSVRGFVAGATNVLFRQQTHLSDAVVEVDEARILICDPELRRSLALSTADLRFADYLLKHVTENKQDVFLDGTGWEGGDEWIRAQFNLYLHSLLSSALQPDRERLLSDYGGSFSAAWTVTHNYRLWISNKHPAMTEIAAGHPFQGQYSVADVKIRLAHSVQNSDRGKKLGNAVVSTSRSVVQTGRVVGQSVGGALTVAKSTMSSWLGLLAPPPQASD